MRPTVSLFLIASALLVTSCAKPEAAVSTETEAAAIRTADEKWSAAAGRRDVNSTVAFYADDAVVLAPNVPIATDRKAIRDSWAELLGPDTSLSWKATKVDVAKSGELGYLYGTYELSMKDPKGGAIHDTGKLVEIWRKQADGTWKCIVDIYNSDIPLPAPPAKK